MCTRILSFTTVGAISLLVLLSCAERAQAQEQLPAVPKGPLTLDQVLDLAEPRSEAIAIARAALRRAEGDQVRARSGGLPQLSAFVSYERALASEFEGVFDSGDTGSSCAPFSLNPQASLEARVAEIERAIDCGSIGSGFFGGSQSTSSEDGGLEDLPFGRKNTFRTQLSFSQNLYSGGRIGAQNAVAVAGHDSAELGLTTARAQVLFDVTQAYYDAALSERLVTIAEATLEQAGATLQQTEFGFEAGTQPEFEVLRARVARDNQTPLVIRQRMNRAVAMLRLKQLLDLPASYELELADALGEDTLPAPRVYAARVATVESSLGSPLAVAVSVDQIAAETQRTVVREADATVRLRAASLELTEAERRPSVAFNSVYGRNAYPAGFVPAFDRVNWTVGVSMTVPILTGGRQRGDEMVARAELEQARAQRQQVEELAGVDSRSALAELVAARASWEASAGTITQAGRAYEIADVRYRAGVSTQLELSDSRVQLQQAEANRAVAARDLQVARARVALLPDLPLATGGTTAVPSRTPQQTPQTPVPAPVQPQQGGQFRNAAVTGPATQAGIQ